MKPQAPDWIPLGIIKRAHGIKGALLVGLTNPASESLQPGIEVVLVKPSTFRRHPGLEPGSSAGSRVKPGMTCQIAEVLSHDRILFKGITDRTEAEKLAGSEIWIKRSDFQEADSDELYLADLMGYEAKDINGKNLGKVTGFSQGAQLLVELDNQLLIPFVKPIWVSINEEAKELIFDLPEGFFDA